jgi:hypothetical protein
MYGQLTHRSRLQHPRFPRAGGSGISALCIQPAGRRRRCSTSTATRSKIRSRIRSGGYTGNRAALLRLGPRFLHLFGETQEQRVDSALNFGDGLRILRCDVVAFVRIGCEVVKLRTRERVVKASLGRRRRVSGGVVPRYVQFPIHPACA